MAPNLTLVWTKQCRRIPETTGKSGKNRFHNQHLLELAGEFMEHPSAD
jgi:hypothetical protein